MLPIEPLVSQSSSSSYVGALPSHLIEMEPLAYQIETVEGMALTFWREI